MSARQTLLENETVIILGDLNKHIGDLIEGNKGDKATLGGNLIKDFISTGNFILVNSSSKVKGGPFTRYDPADPQNKDKKSVLDLCIVSKVLVDYIEEFSIDKERIIIQRQYRKRRNNQQSSWNVINGPSL